MFDGYSCGWWNHRADFQAAMTTPAWQGSKDGPKVFDMDWLWNMSAPSRSTDDRGADEPVQGRVDRSVQGGDRAGGDREYWRSVHGPIFKELDIDRYIQNHVVGSIGEEGEPRAEIGFDGFSECWFRDEAQFRDAVESETWAVAVEDGQNVFDMTQMWGAALKENVVIPPQIAGT